MIDRTHQTNTRRWVLPFLAALVAVLATMLSSASASAATQAGTETRVGAHASSVEVFGGVSGQIAAGQRLGNNAAGPEIVVATGVAAKTGDDLIRLSTKDSWANLKTLDDHFARHGADFGAKSADDYARMGSEFFQRGGAQHLPMKIAPDGTIRMFDLATNTFGSFAPNGMTKTIFKPTSPDYWSRQPGPLQ